MLDWIIIGIVCLLASGALLAIVGVYAIIVWRIGMVLRNSRRRNTRLATKLPDSFWRDRGMLN